VCIRYPPSVLQLKSISTSQPSARHAYSGGSSSGCEQDLVTSKRVVEMDEQRVPAGNTPTLETKRLVLRPLSANEADSLHRISNEPNVRLYRGTAHRSRRRRSRTLSSTVIACSPKRTWGTSTLANPRGSFMRELWRVPSRNRLKSLMSEPNALPSNDSSLHR
jgi:hypothetical protein